MEETSGCQDMLRLCISLLSLALLLQAFEETDNKCKEGEECIHRGKCPSWSHKRAQLKPQERGTQFYKVLLAELLESMCNKKEEGVCCPPTRRSPTRRPPTRRPPTRRPLTRRPLTKRPPRQDSSKLPPIGKCGKHRESVHHIVGGKDT